MDMGVVILRRTTTQQGVELVEVKDLNQDRQVELEATLEVGSYIILPRTSGCFLKRGLPTRLDPAKFV